MNPKNPTSPSAPMEGQQTSDTLAEMKSSAAQTTREAANKVKSVATTTVSRAKEEAERLAQEKKEQAAAQIGDYSSAIHESAKAFEEKDPNIAWFTHRAADRLQGVADYMRNRDFAALRRDAEDVARRHPAGFFGGMFVAGLVIGNLVKASQRRGLERDDRSTKEPSWMDRPETTLGAQPELPMSSSPMPSTAADI